MASALRMAAIDYSHGHQYAYTLAMLALPTVDLVAVADADDGQRRRAAELVAQAPHPVDVYEDYHELLAREDVEAVVICSPNADHCRMTLDAARAGKHVLCEKPLALTLDEADEMIRVCAQEGVYLATAYPCRFSPIMWEMKRDVEAGKIGDILAMSSTNHLGAFNRPSTNWFIDPKRSGGGCIRDHIVHSVDLCRWFSGREPVEVYAEADTLALPTLPVEDTGLLLVTFEDGLVGTIDPSWNRPRTWTRWGDVTMRIVGTQGSIEGDLTAQVVVRTTDTARWLSYAEDMNYYLIKDFAESILAGQAPLVTGWDGRAGVATTLAAYESIKTHLPVRVEQPISDATRPHTANEEESS
jgi:myo-inositol 2-dehydrogenase/D-chiro-inositol 1-dehydrogenase